MSEVDHDWNTTVVCPRAIREPVYIVVGDVCVWSVGSHRRSSGTLAYVSLVEYKQ